MHIQDIKNKIKIKGEKYNSKLVFLFDSLSRGINNAETRIRTRL